MPIGPPLDISDTVDIETSMEDEYEVDSFVTTGCGGCHFGPQKTPCSTFLNKDLIKASREELNKDELDLVSQYSCNDEQLFTTNSTNSTKTNSTSISPCSDKYAVLTSTRLKCEYYIYGVRICRTMFCFLHCLSTTRLDGIISHYQQNGTDCLHALMVMPRDFHRDFHLMLQDTKIRRGAASV